MKSNLHKFFLLFLGLIVFIFTSKASHQDSSLFKKLSQLQSTLKNEFAPDSRLKLLELNTLDFGSNSYEFVTTESAAKKALEQHLKNSIGNIKITLLPDSTVDNKYVGIANLSVANLRTRPSHAAEMATQILLGTQVDILHKRGGDYRVRTPEGYIAWVPTSSIVAMDEEELKNWKTKTKIIITEDYGKSFSDKNIQSLPVSDLVYGDILSLIDQDDSFYQVMYPDSRIAFVKKENARLFDEWLNDREANQENIIKSAKRMMGVPYLWGGTSVKGVDCSGFTKTSFFMNGLIIPRDASQQVLAGQKIDILDANGDFDPNKALKNLQPADLLFFAAGKANSPNARVTHVAIYLGNGEFIHSAGTVRINSMLKEAANYDDFQTRTLVSANRYIGVDDKLIQKIASNKNYK